MSLKTSHLTLLVLIGVFTFNPAFANTQGVCPVLKHDKLRQISIFDGKPEEQAYLAPEDSETAPNTNSLGNIHDAGRSVSIRCEYHSGSVRDIELKNKIRKCLYSERKSGEPRLTCQ